MRVDLGAVEPRAAQELRDPIAEVARDMGAAEHPPCRPPVTGAHRAADVEQMQSAAGSQHPENLCCGLRFHLVVEVVPHHRRQHPVELAVGIGQILGVTAVEPDPGQTAGLAPGPGQGTRIGVSADRVDTWMAAPRPDNDIACTAAYFK